MARQINIAEAKAKLSELVEAASQGEEIVLARNGKPLARLAPLLSAAATGPRVFGKYEHRSKGIDWDKWWDDWKARDREIEADFERSELFPPGFAEKTAKPIAPRKGKPKPFRPE